MRATQVQRVTLTKKNMNKNFLNKLLSITLLVAAQAALLATSAKAGSQQVTFTAQDFLFGVRYTDSSVSAGNNSLLTDLGQISIFNNLVNTNPGAVIDLTTGNFISGGSGASGLNGIGNFGADLSSAFGSGWATATDSGHGSGTWNTGNLAVLFGGIGGVSSGFPTQNTVYVTNTATTYPAAFSNGSLGNARSDYSTLGSSGYSGNTSTANSNFTLLQTGSGTNTYQGHTFQVNGNAADFQQFPSSATPPSFEGPVGTTLSLDKIMPNTTGTELGFFTILANGTFTYTVVPEPSTYSMLALGALGLGGLTILRRRRAARA